ncbi:MAG: DUF3378 domain-containing protein, partial [Bacillota bacterium]|nr:DUF3378 domain-containing protein [Bacillota bacterium]
MGNVVLVRTIDKLMKMKKYYQTYLLDKQPPGSLFSAKTPACMITAYKSGKVLFQGSGGEQEASKWGESDKVNSTNTSNRTKALSSALPPNIRKLSVIGSDEVGTGDFFGPITVVAAYVKKEQIPLLKELGVRDSKDLNDQKICAIAKQIKDIIPYSLLSLHNEK